MHPMLYPSWIVNRGSEQTYEGRLLGATTSALALLVSPSGSLHWLFSAGGDEEIASAACQPFLRAFWTRPRAALVECLASGTVLLRGIRETATFAATNSEVERRQIESLGLPTYAWSSRCGTGVELFVDERNWLLRYSRESRSRTLPWGPLRWVPLPTPQSGRGPKGEPPEADTATLLAYAFHQDLTVCDSDSHCQLDFLCVGACFPLSACSD